MQWVPNEKKEQPEQEPDDLTIAYMTGFHAGKNTPQRKPEQEPVANGIIRTLVSIDKDGIETWKHEPFYTTPPQRKWVGLTDEDKNNCLVSADPCECLAKPESHQLMDDVETKLREKNT